MSELNDKLFAHAFEMGLDPSVAENAVRLSTLSVEGFDKILNVIAKAMVSVQEPKESIKKFMKRVVGNIAGNCYLEGYRDALMATGQLSEQQQTGDQ